MRKLIEAFAFGIVLGIIPCILWGRLGGDKGFKKRHPDLKKLLRLIHHWEVGLFIMTVGLKTHPFILGWGLGTTIDDLLFHSFENYLELKM